MIVDECVTFMLASTQTTTFLIYNTLYYFTKMPEIRERARGEIRTLFNKDNDKENLKDILTHENMTELEYMNMCINETLRHEPSVGASSVAVLTEPIKLLDYSIRNDHYF